MAAAQTWRSSLAVSSSRAAKAHDRRGSSRQLPALALTCDPMHQVIGLTPAHESLECIVTQSAVMRSLESTGSALFLCQVSVSRTDAVTSDAIAAREPSFTVHFAPLQQQDVERPLTPRLSCLSPPCDMAMMSHCFLLLTLVSVSHAFALIDVSSYGYPRRFIFNSTENRNMDRFASMESMPIILRNPVPYSFIEITRRGTQLASAMETTRGRAASLWARMRSWFG